MIFGLLVYLVCAPAGAAAGKVFGHMNGMDEDLMMLLAGLLPPFGAFCAFNVLLKGDLE